MRSRKLDGWGGNVVMGVAAIMLILTATVGIGRAVHASRDNSGTTEASQNSSGSQGLVFTSLTSRSSLLTERVGFEPTVRQNRTPVFETGSFSRSDTSP